MEKTDHIIWSDQIDYEDWREDMESEYPDENEQWRIDRAYEINDAYLDDERCNLNIQLSRPIIVIGDIGRWNGRVMGYKEIKSGTASSAASSRMMRPVKERTIFRFIAASLISECLPGQQGDGSQR